MTADSEFGDEVQLRRSAPRYFAGWPGRYLVDSDKWGRWQECEVMDVSPTGAGLVLPGASAADIQGKRLLVSISFHVAVKNVDEADGHLRVGAEILNISEAERAELEMLSKLGARW